MTLPDAGALGFDPKAPRCLCRHDAAIHRAQLGRAGYPCGQCDCGSYQPEQVMKSHGAIPFPERKDT